MGLDEALKTGRLIKRSRDHHYHDPSDDGCVYSTEDVLADDWEVEPFQMREILGYRGAAQPPKEVGSAMKEVLSDIVDQMCAEPFPPYWRMKNLRLLTRQHADGIVAFSIAEIEPKGDGE